MFPNEERMEELVAQFERHKDVVFWYETNEGDHTEVAITDILYDASENEVRVYFTEI